MRKYLSFTNTAAVVGLAFAISACSSQEEMAPKPAARAPTEKAPAEKSASAKAKTTKASGDVGLMDTEKNYMILVTKQGKLITLDFDGKTKVTKLTRRSAKVGDVGLGSSATVTYTTQGDKNVASALEYRMKKGE